MKLAQVPPARQPFIEEDRRVASHVLPALGLRELFVSEPPDKSSTMASHLEIVPKAICGSFPPTVHGAGRYDNLKALLKRSDTNYPAN